MLAVIYRWRVKEGMESSFREAWREMTEAIRVARGTGGSRLHRAGDGEVVAYALWPSREAWEASGALPSVNPEAGNRMRACIEQSFPPMPLDIVEDLLSAIS